MACEIAPHFRNEFIMYVKFLVLFLFGFSFTSMIVLYGRVICEWVKTETKPDS